MQDSHSNRMIGAARRAMITCRLRLALLSSLQHEVGQLVQPPLQRRISSFTCLRGWVPERQSLLPAYSRLQRRTPSLLVRPAASGAGGKVKSAYVCGQCGEQQLQWGGQCKSCGEWNTLEKVKLALASESGGGGSGARAAARFAASKAAAAAGDVAEATGWSGNSGRSAMPLRRTTWVVETEPPQRLRDVSRRGFRSHWRLHLPGENGRELARVLGGGIVPGSLTLVGGEPGVGKSTLLLQLAAMLGQASTCDPPGGAASSNTDNESPRSQAGGGESLGEEDERRAVLYVSGEESIEQIGSRAERMGISDNNDIYLYSATRLDLILDEITRLQPKAIIVDSIQTVYLDDVPSSAGSITQVRECATALLHVAKREKVPVFLVGHVTKSGDLAGPRVLEHIVDVVVYMEGGRQQPVRLVRTVKNRYGATDEIGVFQMHDDGMQAVPNPSHLFLSNRSFSPSVASVVTVVMEGSRPLLMEVQALCTPLPPGVGHPPVRMPSGVNKNRFYLLLAVLGKHTEMRPYSVDVHLNVTGGLEMSEPATDLAVTLAIASSYFEQPIARDVAAIGEIGLGGELRPIGNIERRISEAAKLGFRRFVIPAGSQVHMSGKLKDVQLLECRSVTDAFRAVLGSDSGTGS